MLDDLLTKITKAGIQAVGYEDDLRIVGRSRFLKPLTSVMQEALELIVD